MPARTRTPTRRPMAAGHAIVTAVVALTVGALFNADGLAETAERQPFGWRRTTAIVAVRPLQAVGGLVGLDRPRHRLAAAVGTSPHDGDRGAGAEASWARSLASPPPGRPGAAQTATPSGAAPRTWSAQDPLRLFIGGDSLVEQYGPALAEHASARTTVTPTVDFHYSSGLTRPDYFDWPARLRDVIAATDPDAIVLMFGANDAQNLKLDDGTVLEFGSPPWQAEYRRRIATVMTEATRGGRTVVWTGQPIMRSDAFGGRMRLLNTLYQGEAGAHPGVTYLDSWALFARPDGRYADYLDPGGPPQRLADGIHLTRAGGERLAAAAYALLAGHWNLPTGS